MNTVPLDSRLRLWGRIRLAAALAYVLLLSAAIAVLVMGRDLQANLGQHISGEDRTLLFRAELEFLTLKFALQRAAASDPSVGIDAIRAATDVLFSRNETLKSHRNSPIFAPVPQAHQVAVTAIERAVEQADRILERETGQVVSAGASAALLAAIETAEVPLQALVHDASAAGAQQRDALLARIETQGARRSFAIATLLIASFAFIGFLIWTARLHERVNEGQRESARALRESELRLRLIADALPAMISYVDAEERVRFINRAGTRWLAQDFPAIVGRTLRELRGEVRYAQIRPRLAEAMAGRSVQSDETVAFPDGRTRRVVVEHHPLINPSGTVEGVVTLVTDVTEQRAIEDQLRQSQKLEVVGQLTGGVAHDFNNLLGVIVGNLDLIEERLPDGSEERTFAQRAADAAERGAALTQRLLAFSRRQALLPRQADVNRLITEMTELLRRSLGEAVRIETDFGAALQLCTVDPGQLESALINLAVNARDAMPHGGLLTIATRNATLDTREAAQLDLTAGDYVTVTVRDNGSGMAPDTLARAFEPFFTTKETGKGSGLGLSMVFGFAKQSGGTVRIDSTVGEGTAVTIYLPVAEPGTDMPAQAGTDKTTRRGPMAGNKQKILVVEDNEAMRLFSTTLVESLGYTPIPAVDGPSALALLDATPDIAAIFSDVVLPGGLNGLELVREARVRRPDLKVLFTSGYTDPAMLPGGQLPGGAVLLSKPFRKIELERRLAELLAA